MALQVTEKARAELNEFFQDREPCLLRIYLKKLCQEAPVLAMALVDKPLPQDVVIEADGYQFCIQQELWTYSGGMVFDVNESGFFAYAVHSLQGAREAGFCCGGGCTACALH